MGERSDAWRGQSTPPGPLEMQVKIKTAGFLAGDSAFLIIAHKSNDRGEVRHHQQSQTIWPR